MVLAGKRVLLVEDEVLIGMAEAQRITRLGYEVTTVTDGPSAVLEVASASPPFDLVLMDIDLGRGLDGTETAKTILRDHDVPIVFLSSHLEPEIVEKTENITSYGYVVKESGVHVLAAAMKMAFHLHAAHREIERGRARLGQALEASHAGTWDWDIEKGSFYWSPEFFKVLGLPQDSPAGFETWRNVLHPDDREAAERRIQEAVDRGTDLLNDYRVLLPNGSIRWIRATGRTYYEGGRAVRMIGLCTDVTERKEAGLELEKSRKRFQDLVETTSDFIWEMDARGRYTYCSPQMKALWGIEPEAMVGKSPFDLVPEEDRAKALEIFGIKAATAEGFRNIIVRSRDAAGRMRLLEINGVPFRDESGRPAGFRGITRDITERNGAGSDPNKNG